MKPAITSGYTTNGTSMAPSTPKMKPTILIIHGSWHTPAHMVPLRSLLHTEGFSTRCPLMATSAKASATVGLADDVRVIQDELQDLVEELNDEVIVVGHSYGCVVMTESVSKEYSVTERRKAGKKGGVIGILYMCGFIINKGTSLSGTFGGTLPPWIVTDEQGMVTPTNPGHMFYHDLSPKEQRRYVNELVPNHGNPQHTEITQAAYIHHPATYLFCEDDQALPLQYQRMMVESVKAATGITVAEETCGASHSPFLSMPSRVVEVLEKMSNES